MNRQEAANQYKEALKAGQKCRKACVLRGSYPYLQVLDDILDDTMVAGRVDLGVIEIPTEQIVGTKTEGRRTAFAANFMPLLPADSEFGTKWLSLCQAHLGDDGIRDPIRCFEYLGRFYVLEGNKRVSVLKSFGAPTVPGSVIRLVPAWSEDPAVQLYYEFLQSYARTQLYRISFTRPGSFSRLAAALGIDPEQDWTPEQRRSFLSGFSYFREAFVKQGGEELPITAADALLVWLKVYSFPELKTMTAGELNKSLAGLWQDVKNLASAAPIAVQTDPEQADKKLVSRMVSAVFPGQLTVAFINERSPEESPWVSAHMQGARHLEQVLGDRVNVLICSATGTGPQAEAAIEEAIAAGAQVVFTTTAPLIHACRKAAARHPGVKILNCSISMPYTGIRTYYGRLFEGKFIAGAIAGAMSPGDRLGYVAESPIIGTPAAINAFALGAKLTNPRATVSLRWSCLPGNPVKELADEGISVISTLDIPAPDQPYSQRGLCLVQPDGALQQLASPFWNWGAFYVKLVRSILGGGWDSLTAGKAVNYWWGMASGVIGLRLSPELPEGVRDLAQLLQKSIQDSSISVFHRHITDQEGAVRNDGSQWLTPEELLSMDWLCSAVEGSIPDFDALLPKARNTVRLLGIHRDTIPADRESPQP